MATRSAGVPAGSGGGGSFTWASAVAIGVPLSNGLDAVSISWARMPRL
ncbi:MAG TPA: hypothetical protein PKN27_05415 [Propionibacteriaceae bacterium]|nr:hypothetical protein [Propionibacteriaceae bacterium]